MPLVEATTGSQFAGKLGATHSLKVIGVTPTPVFVVEQAVVRGISPSRALSLQEGEEHLQVHCVRPPRCRSQSLEA
nr:hypothetical protein [Acidithrix sp. C25]